MSVTVLLADDSAIIRKAIRQVLSDHSAVLLVGEAEDLNEALLKAEQLRPDVLLFDLHLAEKYKQSQGNFIFGDVKLLAMTFGIDEGSRALADRVGVKKLVDKIDLARHLVPAILGLGGDSSDKSLSRPA